MASLFELRGVHVVLGGSEVLAGVDATIEDGGITVIEGPSGSGKSTLLRLFNRLAVPSRGQVLMRGADLADSDPLALRRRVGMVFQRPTPFDGTVADNLLVAEPTSSLGDQRELLDQVGLDAAMLGREARSLSGGEQQRVCLARTLATGCEVVLADEATSSLDVEATAVVERTARRLADSGRTVLWVTHDVEQAARLADHRVRMRGGRRVD